MTGDIEATLSLGTGIDAPARARHHLQAMLVERGRHELVERALLLASEVVTNAVIHGKGAVTMTTLLGPVLRVEVRDAATRLPVLRHPPPQSVTGRGLMLVDLLALRWGHVLEGEGKCVWFELGPTDLGETPVGTSRARGSGSARAAARPAAPGERDRACV